MFYNLSNLEKRKIYFYSLQKLINFTDIIYDGKLHLTSKYFDLRTILWNQVNFVSHGSSVNVQITYLLVFKFFAVEL